MSELTGRITLNGTNFGVPNLVISLVPAAIGREPTTENVVSSRTASTLSDQDGAFRITMAPTAPGAVGPSLSRMFLCITTPERGEGGNVIVLHTTQDFAASPNASQAFVFAVSATALEKGGVPVPGLSPRRPTPKELAASANELEESREAERASRQTVAKRRLAARLSARDTFRSEFEPALRASLAGFTAGKTPPRNFVSDPDSVIEKCVEITKAGLRERVNTADARDKVVGVVHLSRQHLATLASYASAGAGFDNVPGGQVVDPSGATFEQILRGRSASETAARQRISPISATCSSVRSREASAGQMLGVEVVNGEAPGTGSSGSASPNNGNGAAPATLITGKELPLGLVDVLSTIVSPEWVPSLAESKGSLGAGNRAGENFYLVPGPADQAAFYDFHRLDMAFEPVWQAAMDQDLLDAMENAYQVFVERTGTTPFPPVSGVKTIDSHFRLMKVAINLEVEFVPAEVLEAFEITLSQWIDLHDSLKPRLIELARIIVSSDGLWDAWQRAVARAQGEQLIRNAVQSRVPTLYSLVEELETRAKAQYPFTLFAANGTQRSVNFGLVTTYRQEWTPVAYQVGRLVRSEPLAPKETRKFSRKTVIKRSRAEREVSNSLRSRKDEMDSTRRSEAEIVRKALGKSSFSLSAEGSYDIGISSGTAKTGFDKSAEVASDETKKDFHEAVVKAAQEYRDERNVEVNVTDARDAEAEASGEISNPNDEITVTYLFYELQRRVRVHEKLHRLTPVIFVAQEVPSPGEVDEDWLVAHDWILRRVILDDSFVPALGYLSARLPGDELALEQMRKTLVLQRELTRTLQSEVVALQDGATRRYAALERSVEKRAEAVGDESTDSMWGDAWEFLSGSGASPEAAQVREDAARDAYEKASRDEKELRMRVEREVTALAAATDSYSRALAEHTNRKAQVARLKQHVTQNILHYMQAIWSHEPPDQRFFRLHRVAVPVLRAQTHTYSLRPVPAGAGVGLPGLRPPDAFEVTCNAELEVAGNGAPETAELATVADLDAPLGYKGNYMIFPLKSSNALTDFMMTPYVDAQLGLRDPDDLANWTLEEFAEYVLCLQRHHPNQFVSAKMELAEIYKALLAKPLRNGEEILVPTDSLYIEALPGSHSVLETFKLRHRAMDVMKVRAEVRGAEIENVRMAARLLAAEYDDPTIDKRVVIQGSSTDVLVPGDA